ncbi:MAG: hypothetical protein IJB49_02085, partial [Clostridia bacterium]|nr:hypothetical protein [Clostridia bacterium]
GDAFIGINGGIQGYNMFAYCNNSPVAFADATGMAFYLNIIVGLAPGPDRPVERVKSGGKVGCAKPYISDDSTDYNCYAYALGEKSWKYVGGDAESVTDFNVDSVKQMVLEDAERDGRRVRLIDSYDSPIRSNEYRIALRTGKDDYHFMIQHSDGSWSHKPGRAKTRLINGANPSVVNWDLILIDGFLSNFGFIKEIGVIPNYYDSETIYFAVAVE